MAERPIRVIEESGKPRERRFMRYREAAAHYGIGLSKMQKLAREAKSTYRVDGIVLVNMDKFERFLEAFAED